MAKCRVCGAPHKACGPATTVVPVDSNVSKIQGGSMTLKRYEVTVSGRRETKTVLQLNDEDAKAAGLTSKDLVDSKPARKAAPAAANKARTPRNKAAAKPAAKADKPAGNPPATAVEEATDPDASE